MLGTNTRLWKIIVDGGNRVVFQPEVDYFPIKGNPEVLYSSHTTAFCQLQVFRLL